MHYKLTFYHREYNNVILCLFIRLKLDEIVSYSNWNLVLHLTKYFFGKKKQNKKLKEKETQMNAEKNETKS